MNNTYVVVKHFKDRITGEYYGIGATYQANDENRRDELVNGGFIAQEGSFEANAAMEQAQQEQQNDGSQLEEVDKAQTVVDGNIVDAKQAHEAMKQQEANMKLSGVTEKDNNASEPVQAGKRASSKTQSVKGARKSVRTKQLGQEDVQVENAQPERESTQMQDAQQQGSNQQQEEAAKTKAAAKGKK